jgi:hypothetical protein
VPRILYSLQPTLKMMPAYLFKVSSSGFLWCNSPIRASDILLSRFQLDTDTLSKTPLEDGTARCRYRSLRKICKRKPSIPQAGFEPAIPASERPHTYVLDSAATGIGFSSHILKKNYCHYFETPCRWAQTSDCITIVVEIRCNSRKNSPEPLCQPHIPHDLLTV